MVVKKRKDSPAVFNKMKKLILEYWPCNIKKSKFQSDIEERCVNDDLEEFDRAYDVEASQETDAEVK